MINIFRYVMFLAAAGLLFLSTVRADEWDQRTVVTINQPIEIPNQVLEPGTYVFRLADSQSNRHIVQVYDKDQKHLIATVLAIPNERLQPTGKTQMTFWERAAGTPSALRAWFYPGDNFGQEFAYPPAQAAKIEAYAHEPVVTTSEYPKEQVTQTQPPAATQPPAQAAAPAPPAPPQHTEPAPPPAPREEAAAPPPPPAQAAPPQETAPQPPTELPHTGSSAALFALTGLLALIGGAATFLAPVRRR